MRTIHTPGPWKAVHSEGLYWDVMADSSHFISPVAACYDPQNSEADAKLIAAAPEMLAALQDIKSFLSNSQIPGAINAAARLERLIAKAEGRANA